MNAASISFFASAVVASLAAIVAVTVRRRERALAGFAVALAAMIVPLIQLRATTVAALILLAAAVGVVLLGVLARLAGPPQPKPAPTRRLPWAYWAAAGLGLLGFVWVVLATGSRQVVDHGPTLARSRYGDGGALVLELGTELVVPAALVGLLALCAVIAAVLGLVASEPGS